jgi:hypothetical protein
MEIIPEHCLLEVLLPEVPLAEMLWPEVEVLLVVETKAAFDVATEQLNRQDQNSSSQGFLLKKEHKLRFLFTDGFIVTSLDSCSQIDLSSLYLGFLLIEGNVVTR